MWLLTTKAIWPWVRTEALGRPVVPEVKKNQAGSSYSTSASGSAWPSYAATMPSHASPNGASPTASSNSPGAMAAAAAACPGNSAWHTIAAAPAVRHRSATSSAVMRKLAGTYTAPSRKQANIASIIW